MEESLADSSCSKSVPCKEMLEVKSVFSNIKLEVEELAKSLSSALKANLKEEYLSYVSSLKDASCDVGVKTESPSSEYNSSLNVFLNIGEREGTDLLKEHPLSLTDIMLLQDDDKVKVENVSNNNCVSDPDAGVKDDKFETRTALNKYFPSSCKLESQDGKGECSSNCGLSYSKTISENIKVEIKCETSITCSDPILENALKCENWAETECSSPIRMKDDFPSTSTILTSQKESSCTFSNDQVLEMLWDVERPSSAFDPTGDYGEESSKLDDGCQYQASVTEKVRSLLTQAGYASRASEYVVSQIVEILRIGTLPTEEHLEALIRDGCHMQNSDQDERGDHNNNKKALPETQSQTISQKYSTFNQSVKGHSDGLFPESGCVEQHIKTQRYHYQKKFSCSVCQKNFSRDSLLQKHIRSHGKSKRIECQECGKTFAKKSMLQQHTTVHTGLKTHQCPTCGKVYFQSSHLLRHIRTHTGEKPPKRSTCKKTLDSKSTLLKHIKTNISSEVEIREKRFKCSTTNCGKYFHSKTDLGRHKRTHTGEKPYTCSTCGKAFSQNSDLKRHRSGHTGDRPYKCHTCGHFFSRKDVLQKHIRRHTGEKPYKCSVCSKAYSVRSSLQFHIKTHSRE